MSAVVVHPTAYDGCVELARLSLGYPVVGSSNVEVYHRSAKEIIKNHLLQVECFLVSFTVYRTHGLLHDTDI